MASQYKVKLVSRPGQQNKYWSALRELEIETFSTDQPYDLSKGYWWIVYCKDTPVGFAGLDECPDGTYFMSRAGVLPAHRGKGLHKRLITIRLAYAKRLGTHEVWTYVEDVNVASKNNLLAKGFKPYYTSVSPTSYNKRCTTWISLSKIIE